MTVVAPQKRFYSKKLNPSPPLLPEITFKTIQPEEHMSSSTSSSTFSSHQQHHHAISSSSPPLVILHGLFGSYLNFSTFARHYSSKFRTRVYLVNLRNHSDPQNHSPEMTFTLMASDLAQFLQKQEISECDLFGFSLGGKTAMTACLSDEFKQSVAQKVRKLVVGDISPLPLRDSEWDIPHVVQALLLLDEKLPEMKTRSEADAFLQTYIPNVEVRGFLLSNLKRNENEPHIRKGVFDWKFNLKAISSNLHEIADFPYKTQRVFNEMVELGQNYSIRNEPWTSFEKETLFLKGGKSNLINTKSHRTMETIQTFFPNYKLFEFENCGHWIHAEKYSLFVKVMEEFLVNDHSEK